VGKNETELFYTIYKNQSQAAGRPKHERQNYQAFRRYCRTVFMTTGLEGYLKSRGKKY
jgi:hypothetical protein